MTFDEIASIPLIKGGSLESSKHHGLVVTLDFQQRINYVGESKPEKLLYQSKYVVKSDGTICTAPILTTILNNSLKAVEYSGNHAIYISSNDEKSWFDIWNTHPWTFSKRIELKDQKVLFDVTFVSRGWSHDGSKFVITSYPIKKANEFEYKESWGECLTDVYETQINIVDPFSGDIETFSAPEGYSAGQAVYSTKNNAIFYIGYVNKPRKYGLVYCANRPTVLLKYDLKTKQSTKLTNDTDSIRSPLMNAEETAIVYLTNSVFAAHIKCSALILLDLETMNTKTIIDVFDDKFVQALSIPKQRLINDILYLDTYHGPMMRVLQVNLNTKQSTFIGTLLENASSRFIGIENGIILLAETCNNQPWHLTFARINDATVRSTSLHSPSIECIDVSIYRCKDDQSLNSLILKPKHHTQPLPLIVLIHGKLLSIILGGPHSVTSTEFNWMLAGLVETGYAIAGINYTGGLGEGEAHVNKLLGHVGRLDVQTCMHLIEKVLEKYKEFDRTKVILLGGSHGGFLSTWLAGLYPDKWRAVIIRNPSTDYYSMLMTSDIPDAILGDSGHHTHVGLSSELVVDLFERSPITVAHKVKAPVLLFLGASDRRVPPSQGLAWMNYLPANTIKKIRIFPEDKHALDKPETERDTMENILSFLREHLNEDSSKQMSI